MNSTFRSVAAFLLILSMPVLAEPRRSDERRHGPTVHVRVFNYANASGVAVAKAMNEAGRIFKMSGIRIDWIDCSDSRREAETNRGCTAKTKPDDIVVRILAREMAEFKNHAEFGVALIPPNGGFGKHASIFHSRVADFAERRQTPESLLLGHLIAHEIGHLLLGANSHSGNGIMNVRWTRKQIERAWTGALLFSDREATKMRAQVLERMQ